MYILPVLCIESQCIIQHSVYMYKIIAVFRDDIHHWALVCRGTQTDHDATWLAYHSQLLSYEIAIYFSNCLYSQQFLWVDGHNFLFLLDFAGHIQCDKRWHLAAYSSAVDEVFIMMLIMFVS